MRGNSTDRPRWTLNAAFLQEIKTDHQQLRDVLEALRETCLTDAPQNIEPERFVELLTELRDQLAFRFSLEETYGYVPGPPNGKPDAAAAITRLRADHIYLFERTARLTAAAHNLLYPRPRRLGLAQLREEFWCLDIRLERHEENELELCSLLAPTISATRWSPA